MAIALRNRVRRRMLPEDMRNEVLPKNILMIGPTGVGKTEIARRVARLTESPFIKVEATKFTEVGYVGRDVESILRDLLEQTITELHDGPHRRGRAAGARPRRRAARRDPPRRRRASARRAQPTRRGRRRAPTRSRRTPAVRAPGAAGSPAAWRPGTLEDATVDIEVEEPFQPAFEGFTGTGLEEVGVSLSDFFSQLAPPRKRKKLMTVAEARDVLVDEETDRLIDMDRVYDDAIRLVEDSGVVFIDEVDKICGPASDRGPDVSGEGVQRDLLPILEGSTVHTRYGPVRTDHVLFIAAGAFTAARPSDLIPEFQGRFPIRVELKPLSEDDLVRILTEPGNALTRQYAALLGTEQVDPRLHPGRDSRARRPGAPRQRGGREPRRPPPVHDHGEGARGRLLRRRGARRDHGGHRRRLRRRAPRRPGPQPGPPPLRALTPARAGVGSRAGLVHSAHLTRSVSRGRRVPGAPGSPPRFTPDGGTTPPQQERPPMPAVTLRQLLEAGVHFGHQTSRWNPRMRPYIFTARNGIHIIDLEQTQKQLDVACEYLRDIVGSGQKVLFVGTKKQAQDVIEEVCRNTGQAYVTHRWMGGMLTNFHGHPAPPAPSRRAARHAVEGRLRAHERQGGQRREGRPRAPREQLRRHGRHEAPSRCGLRHRLQEGAHRGHRGQQAEHPDRRHRRHQLRPRRHPGGHPRQRRRDAQLPADRERDRQGDRRGPAAVQRARDAGAAGGRAARARSAVAAEAAAVVAAEQAAAAAAHADAIAAEQAAAAPRRGARCRPAPRLRWGGEAADGRGHRRDGQGLARAHRRGHDGLQTRAGRDPTATWTRPRTGCAPRDSRVQPRRPGAAPTRAWSRPTSTTPVASPSRVRSSRSTASRTSSPRPTTSSTSRTRSRSRWSACAPHVRPPRGRPRGDRRARARRLSRAGAGQAGEHRREDPQRQARRLLRADLPARAAVDQGRQEEGRRPGDRSDRQARREHLGGALRPLRGGR